MALFCLLQRRLNHEPTGFIALTAQKYREAQNNKVHSKHCTDEHWQLRLTQSFSTRPQLMSNARQFSLVCANWSGENSSDCNFAFGLDKWAKCKQISQQSHFNQRFYRFHPKNGGANKFEKRELFIILRHSWSATDSWWEIWGCIISLWLRFATNCLPRYAVHSQAIINGLTVDSILFCTTVHKGAFL